LVGGGGVVGAEIERIPLVFSVWGSLTNDSLPGGVETYVDVGVIAGKHGSHDILRRREACSVRQLTTQSANQRVETSKGIEMYCAICGAKKPVPS
jgi:hypothetical protein